MVWLFQRLHSNTSYSTGAPAQALSQPGGFGGQGGITEALWPVPLRAELQGSCRLSCLQSWCHSCSVQTLLDLGSNFAGCILCI